MRKTYYTYLLLGSTILSGTMLNLSTAQAACTPSPDCKTLGYTETSCPDAGAKCPWNTSLMFCICGSDYIHTCTGSNETAGVGTACNGKYARCTCAEGYEWSGSSCHVSCNVVGHILNSDMTCSTDLVSGKTPIGVVSYINGSTRLAIQVDSQEAMEWGGDETDLNGIPNYSSSPHTADFSGKSNTRAWLNYYGGSATSYAPGYCNAYSTTGTSAGDWYLPAQGELYASVWTNSSAVNAGLSKAGGTPIVRSSLWSSSEYSKYSAWEVSAYDGDLDYAMKDTCYRYVRCVLEFEDSGNGTAKVCGSEYIYTCTGEGESPIGESCGGKYTACTTNCAVGDILNSDMTCSTDLVSGKTPIGVVSYVNGSTRIAIQLDSPSKMPWSANYVDISGIPNTGSDSSLNDFNGKSNTQAWVDYYGTNEPDYAPAYCYNYATTGTSRGDWYLPAQGELNAFTYTNYSTVNAGLSKAGGTAIVESWYWSSSEYNNYYAWVSGGGGSWTCTSKLDFGNVRCVLAF